MFWFSICFPNSTISTYVCLRFHYLNLDLIFVLLISSFLAFHLNLKAFFKKIFFSICVNSIRSVFKLVLNFIFLKSWWYFFSVVVSVFLSVFLIFSVGSYIWIFFFRYSWYNFLWFFYILIWILSVFTPDCHEIWGLIIFALCSVCISVLLF